MRGTWPAIWPRSPDDGSDPVTSGNDRVTRTHHPRLGTGDSGGAPLPRVTCPYCGATVPDAPFCGSCGAHLAHAGPSGGPSGGGARRVHAYSAFPDEAAMRLTVV